VNAQAMSPSCCQNKPLIRERETNKQNKQGNLGWRIYAYILWKLNWMCYAN